MNKIPQTPQGLENFLDKLTVGDDKHQPDAAFSQEMRAELDATKAELKSRNGAVQRSKGQSRQDTQDRREFMKTALVRAEKYKDAVLVKYGHTDPVLVDYALATRRKRSKAGSAEGGANPKVSTTQRRLERAQVRLSRAQAELERAKGRLSKAETVLAQREADVAKAAPVAPPEPTTTSDPTSSSATK